MKIAIIHGSNMGFFPRFYRSLKAAAEAEGHCMELFCPNSGQNKRVELPGQHVFGSRLNWHIHHLLFCLTGRQDCWSHPDTLHLVSQLKAFSPDVLHLHVVSQCQLHLPMLVRYANSHNIPVVWTFHDCRAFTGGCPYFDEIGCDAWQTGCKICPLHTQAGNYTTGSTSWQWNFYNHWLHQLHALHIVTPSRWLADFVGQSFLKDRPCRVIYNGVDTGRFAAPSAFDVRFAYRIGGKKIILGCAINWEVRKGMKFFEQVAPLLPGDYKIVLVGGIGDADRTRLEGQGILVTGRTKTFDEMVAWYQQASVFVNPTLADNFPTTNIESLAAGTPIVTFRTGGSPEAIDEQTGIVVEQGDAQGLAAAIIDVAENRDRYTTEACRHRSARFTDENYKEYVKLYREI